MAKQKPPAIETFTVPAAQPTGDPFERAFRDVIEKKEAANNAFLAQREAFLQEYAELVWRRARGLGTVQDAGRLIELVDSDALSDLKIDKAAFDRHVAICQRWDMQRALFATVPTLQADRDKCHARVRELQEQLRAAETAASGAAGSLYTAHEADANSKQIARQNVMFFDPVTNSPRDGSVVSIDDFVEANTGKVGAK